MERVKVNENREEVWKTRNATTPVYRSPQLCSPKSKLVVAWVVTAMVLASVVYFMIASYNREPLHHAPMNIRNMAHRQLVVIMLSGMRWDHLEIFPPETYGPGFCRMKEDGVRVEHVETVFPSLKMPAWASLQTGVFPDKHGILGNVMYDRETGQRFNWNTGENINDPRWWQKAEPIWITATRQKRRVATIEWQSADVPYHGKLPEVAGGYTGSKRCFQDRMDAVIKRLKEGFHLVMMAYDGVEQAMERYGLYSKQVRSELRAIGDGLGTLLDFVERNELQRTVNVLVVSDHGFSSPCAMPAPINMSALAHVRNPQGLLEDVERVEEDEGLYLIFTRTDRAAATASRLSGSATPGYETRLRKEIPMEFHYSNAERSPDVLVFALPLPPESGFSVELDERRHWAGMASLAWPPKTTCSVGGGVCGLDPRRSPSMRTLLLGWGTVFAGRGLVHPPLSIVQVYQLVAHILEVRPAPHDGHWSVVRGLFGGNCCYGIDKITEEESRFDVRRYLSERYAFTQLWEMKFEALRAQNGGVDAAPSAIAAANAVTIALALVLHWCGDVTAATVAAANAVSISLALVLH